MYVSHVHHHSISKPARIIALALAGTMVASCGVMAPSNAYAVTAAEKQAEADAVFAQIDSLQTSLNEAMDEYANAQSSYDDAIAKRDDAEKQIDEQSARIEELQGELSEFARGMYRQGGAGSFLDVLFDTTSFEQFLTTWDACSDIAKSGSALIDEARQAKADLEEAKASYEAEGARAEEEMAVAEEKQQEIEQTQAALREQAESLSQEAAKLQAEEELAAERARQAEEARKKREAEIAAAQEAAEAAAKAEAERAAAEEQAAADEAAAEEEAAATEDYSAGGTVAMGTGYFTNPCPDATYSSGFGWRDFDSSFHMGLDMAASEGTPYYAADSGTVMYATNDGGYNGGAGNWVVIAHGNGIVTKYMHSLQTFVSPGDQVERGQNIGLVGNTGNSFGAHLHFQVEVDGVAVNPLNYI